MNKRQLQRAIERAEQRKCEKLSPPEDLLRKSPVEAVNDIFHEAHTSLLTQSLGSEQAAEDVRRQASELRARYDLCLHADDERVYKTEQELDKDKSSLLSLARGG